MAWQENLKRTQSKKPFFSDPTAIPFRSPLLSQLRSPLLSPLQNQPPSPLPSPLRSQPPSQHQNQLLSPLLGKGGKSLAILG